MGLTEYRRKRRFHETPEPRGGVRSPSKRSQLRFVVQKHAASRLHYDFRLELEGVLKSWAVPKGPSLDPRVKSLAVHVEDHPLDYGSFEGTIPPKQYGAGTVMVWDHGTWEPEGDPQRGYREGKLTFDLHGEKLVGRWTLIRMGGKAGDGGKNWLLKKNADSDARTDGRAVVEEEPNSVVSGRTLDEIAAGDVIWSDGRAQKKTTREGTFPAKVAGKKSPRAKRTVPSRSVTSRDRTSTSSSTTPDSLPTPASLPGAVRRRLPKTFQPQLATLVREIPATDEWLHELKFDGYRLVGWLRRGKLQLLSRRGKDWTRRFPTIANALRKLAVKDAILDGEVVVLAASGASDFQALQNILQQKRDDNLVWYVFDLPHCNGYDLTDTPLVERKKLLQQVLQESSPDRTIRYSDHLIGNGPAVYADACQRGVEGLISKRADSPYRQRRSRDWLKVKCLGRQEFVIAGWTDPGGGRRGFGALLLGYYDSHGDLRYAGRVGTGFTDRSLRQLASRLEALERKQPPFKHPPTGSAARGVHWTAPQLVAEVEFTEWTKEGRLRHPSFQGLREDKQPREVRREQSAANSPDAAEAANSEPGGSQPGGSQPNGSPQRNGSPRRHGSKRKVSAPAKRKRTGKTSEFPAGVRLTHATRVLYREQGVTKRDLAEYYVQIADWILPHVIQRPLTLVRCPKGAEGQCFYQKHLAQSLPAPVRGIRVTGEKESHQYVAIDDLAGLVTLVQMSALELHPWGSREEKLEHPDRIILDLDPGAGVPWSKVVAAALEVRGVLAAVGLNGYVRTTGGKGLHVVVPLLPRASWDVVKNLAHGIADFFARHDPSMYVATSSKSRRGGKIYVDYLRNARGATAIASYSTRVRAGAPVATPLHWDELSPRIDPAAFNLKTVPERLASRRSDPWDGFFQEEQSVTAATLKELAKHK